MQRNIICIQNFRNILLHGMLMEVNVLAYFLFYKEIYQFIMHISLILALQ